MWKSSAQKLEFDGQKPLFETLLASRNRDSRSTKPWSRGLSLSLTSPAVASGKPVHQIRAYNTSPFLGERGICGLAVGPEYCDFIGFCRFGICGGVRRERRKLLRRAPFGLHFNFSIRRHDQQGRQPSVCRHRNFFGWRSEAPHIGHLDFLQPRRCHGYRGGFGRWGESRKHDDSGFFGLG